MGVTVADIRNRDDVMEMRIPANCKAWVTGDRGRELRRIEQATGTYIFMANDASGEERLLIFGVIEGSEYAQGGLGGRKLAQKMVNELIQEKLRSGKNRRDRSNSRHRNTARRSRSHRRHSRSASRRRRRSPSSRARSPRRRSPS